MAAISTSRPYWPIARRGTADAGSVGGNRAEIIAAAATALVYWLTKNLFAAMAMGALIVYLARLALAG